MQGLSGLVVPSLSRRLVTLSSTSWLDLRLPVLKTPRDFQFLRAKVPLGFCPISSPWNNGGKRILWSNVLGKQSTLSYFLETQSSLVS